MLKIQFFHRDGSVFFLPGVRLRGHENNFAKLTNRRAGTVTSPARRVLWP